MGIANAFTVDVEEWFHIAGIHGLKRVAEWDQYESRVVGNTTRLLDIMEEKDVRGTFFVLGWVAEKYPGLVKEIHKRGHELGTHGYDHRPVLPGTISHQVVSISDKYIIGIFLGATFVGYYSPGYALGLKFPLLISSVLSLILLPSLSEYYENNNIKLVKKILNLSIKFFLLLAIPALVGVIIVGRQILMVLTTPEIAERSYIILIIIVFSGILMGIYTIIKQIVFLKKKTKLITYYWTAGATINLVGNLILIPQVGIAGAAITTLASYLLVLILTINFSSKEMPIKPDYISIIKIISSSILMGFILYFTSILIWSNLFFLIALGIVTYFSILFILGGFGKREIDYLMNLRK